MAHLPTDHSAATSVTKKTRFIAAAIVVMIWGSTAVAAPYDLAACIERGLNANPEMASRKIALAEVDKELGKSGYLFLPTLSVSHQMNSLNNAGTTERNADYIDQQGTTTNFRLTQPLFSGLAGVTTLEKVKYLKQYRQAEFHEARFALIRDIQRQFFTYLRLTDELTAAQETISGLEKQLAVAQAFFAQGMAAKQQVLQVEVRLSTVMQELLQIKTLLDNRSVMLNELLNLEHENVAEFTGRLADFPYNIPQPLEDYLSSAEKRPDLEMATINIELAKRESKLILSRSLPQVNAEANFNENEIDYKNALYRDENRDYWSVGVNMSMNIFRGGADIAAFSQQLLTASRYEEDRRKLRNKMHTDVRTTFASLEESRSRIDSAFKIKELATSALDGAWAKFKTGIGTTVEILDAQEEVSRAMIAIAKARADFQIAQADLNYLAGQEHGYGNGAVDAKTP